MGKKKSYINCKVKFSRLTNPFNFVNVKNSKRSHYFAKQKNIIKINKALSQKSNVYIDERKTCPIVSFGDHVTDKFMKEGQRKRKKLSFNLNENQLSSSAIPLQDANSSDGSHKNDYNDLISNNKRQKLEKKVEKDLYKSALMSVDDSWKKVQNLCLKNKSAPICSSDTKDSYDIAKSELQFEPKYVVQASSKNIQPLKVLFDIKDFNLDIMFENASNNEFINDVVQDLHFLATKNNMDTAEKFREILLEEYDIFSYFKKCNMKRSFPRCQTVSLLSIVSRIYSTTEIRHPVVTPAMIFMCDILGSECYYSYNNVLARLLICEIAMNCVSQSKRFIPEALQFLKSVLQLALPKVTKSKNDAAFRKRFDLIISEKVSSEEIPALQLYPKDKNLSLESKKVGVIFNVASQVSCFATLYNDYPLFKIIFEPLLTIFSRLPVHLYPAEMKTLIKGLIEFLCRETPPLRHLTFRTVKPTPFKMFEPAFDCKYESIEELERQMNHNANTKDNKKKKNISEQQRRLKSVKQKIRKEERCLLREIRKSNKAAASVKFEEKRALDAERQKMIAKIYTDLAIQEGEFKKLMKKK